jgi:hypothetical protein
MIMHAKYPITHVACADTAAAAAAAAATAAAAALGVLHTFSQQSSSSSIWISAADAPAWSRRRCNDGHWPTIPSKTSQFRISQAVLVLCWLAIAATLTLHDCGRNDSGCDFLRVTNSQTELLLLQLLQQLELDELLL